MWKPTPPPFVAFKKQTFKKAALVSDFIYQIGETELLRIPSIPVPLKEITSPSQQRKFKYLKKCLLKYRTLTGYGRGITAVQVGIHERFSVIYTEKELITIVNPEITKQSEMLYKYSEMCMSANPVIAPTIRPAWIEFNYYDENGKKQLWDIKCDTLQGKIMNRVFQHEIDHMNGVINIDRVEDPKELILESDPKYYQTAGFVEVNSR